MDKFYEIQYLDLAENSEYEKIIDKVVKKCFEVESLLESKLYVSITLTTPENIRKLNKEYRNIDKETDVLSFPMFEKEELKDFKSSCKEVLGDIVISVERVKQQAVEYGHSFERELSYMVVHGFYHLMGYDHIKDEDQKQMREKEEVILKELNIQR